MKDLKDQLAFHNREATRILNEKGSRAWSADDQAAFDAQMDAADRIQRQITARQQRLNADAERNFKDARRLSSSEPKQYGPAAAAGLNAFLRKDESEWSPQDRHAVSNTMSTTTQSEGGYTLAPQVASELVDSLKDYGAVRRLAGYMRTTNGADFTMPYTDGRYESGELVAQNTSASSSDPTIGGAPLTTYKFGSKIITVPIELIQDSGIDIADMVFKRARDRIGRAQNTYFTTGTGTAQPFGLAIQSRVAIVGGAGSAGLSGITYETLVDLVDCLDVSYLNEVDPAAADGQAGSGPGPAWMFNQTVRAYLRKLKDSAGRPIWTPSYDAGITVKADYLLGYPVALNNDMPTPAANAISLAFGNFSKYTVRDAMEVTLFRFNDSVYASKGQVGFLAWARAGGNLLDPSSVVAYKHGAT